MSKSNAEVRADKLRARLEKLADSADTKVSSKAVEGLVQMHLSEVEIESREDRIMPLRKQVADLEKKLSAAEASLSPVTAERDTLAAKVAELEPLAATAQELETVRAEMVTWKAEQTKLLVAENQEYCWKAQRAEHAAQETLETAQARYGKEGLQSLFDAVKQLIERHRIPEPVLTELPNGISPHYLTLWGYPIVRAQLMLSYAKSFPAPNEDFKNTLARILMASLPIYQDMPSPDPILNISIKREVLTGMAIKWNVLHEVQQRVDDEHAHRQALHMQSNIISLAAQQQDLARQGYGREPIAEAASTSSVPIEEHLPGCMGACCAGRGTQLPNSLDEVEVF